MKLIPSSLLTLLGVVFVIGVPLASRADVRVPQEAPPAQEADTVVAMHERAMLYPSAMQCASCHPDQARQWSVSPHAYTMVSPIFQAMAGFVGRHTQGTNGDY